MSECKENKRLFTKKILIYLSFCFFLSGMCGLIYQVLWSRMLSLIFGHTTFAISTVITAFMGGLALGSYFLGRWADSEGKFKTFLAKQGVSPIFLMYGILEAFVGIYCLFTPVLLKLVEYVYLNFSELPFYFMSILRFILCMVVLIIPTFCMGGTLPLLSKFLIRNSDELSKKLGFLYFINTMGAVVGTVLAGFYLIITFGITPTLRFAAIINIGIGILIYMLNKTPQNIFSPGQIEDTPVSQSSQIKEKTGYRVSAGLIFVIFAFTGFGSMIYELAWTRALALSLGSSTYAFSTMLATFLFGIALGSILYTRFCNKVSEGTFGWMEISIGLTCLATIPLLGRMPLYVISLFPMIKNFYNLIIVTNFIFCFIVMLIPTTLMGFVFPLVGRIYTRSVQQIGKNIGDIYAINTLGCILGSFLTGFILIPFMGVQNSLKLAVVINILSGGIFLHQYFTRLRTRLILIVSLVVIIILANFVPSWDPAIMSSGSAIYAADITGIVQKVQVEKNKYFDTMRKFLVFQKDGISSTVSVYDFKDVIFLKINGKVDASTRGDMPTQLLLGYLPLLYDDKAQDVFVIGLGSGLTPKAVLDFPQVKSVVCAELEPAVVEANRFFTSFNDRVLSNSRFKININDGRNALLASGKKYDIIISEPSNPWIAGVGNLFTRDHYDLCKDRLKEDGVMCQWLQLYNLAPFDIEMILRTFYSVFPQGVIWIGAEGDLLLLGSKKPLLFDYSKFTDYYNNNKAFQKSLHSIDIDSPDMIFAHYVTRLGKLEDINAGIINTDELPMLEFSAPRSLYSDTFLVNIKKIYNTYKTDLLPPLKNENDCKTLSGKYYIKMIRFYTTIHMPESADKILYEALDLYPLDVTLQIMKIRRLIQLNQILNARKELLSLISRYPSEYRYYLEFARLYCNQGLLDEASRMYFQAELCQKKSTKRH